MTTLAPPAEVEPEEPESVDERRRAFEIDRPTAILCGLTAVVASVVYWAIHYSLADDAYITLAYAKNLAYHGEWGMIPHHVSNSATSPLNVLLIGAGTFLTRRPLLALGFVFVTANVVIAYTTARVAKALDLSIASAAIAVALVLFNPFVLSSTGLESIVVGAMLGLLLWSAIEERPVAFGIIAGLSMLARLDMILFIVLIALSARAIRRSILKVAGIAILVTVPWFLPRWTSGSAIPDTFVIKTLQHSFGVATFGNGPFRFMDWFHSRARSAFAPVGLAILVFVGWTAYLLIRDRAGARRFAPVIALGVGGAAYYGVYSTLNVPPYHWYYSPVIEAAAIVLGLALGDIARRVAHVDVLRRVAPLVFVPAIALVAWQLVVIKHHGLPWKQEPIIYTNWATPGSYKAVAVGLKERVPKDATISSPGEVGALVFYCECQVVDMFSDQRYALPLINDRIDRAAPVMKWLLKTNYRYLDLDIGPPATAYHLVWEPGWVDDPNTWAVYSTWRGFGHFRLIGP